MDDMIQNRNALKQEIDSLKQTLSKQVKEKESLLQTFTVFKKESKEKENKYMDKEIDLEKKIKELDNIVYKVGQSAQTVHMLTKPQVFYDHTHKQALSYQNPFYLKKAQRIKPMLYDDKTYFDIQKKEIFLDNDRLLEHIICQDVMNIVMHADSVSVNVHSSHLCKFSCYRNECCEMQQSFIHEYNENLVLKAELAKKEHMVEKKVFDEVVLRFSRLENHCVNLELKLQHQKDSFLNNTPLNNQNAPEIHEIFTINEWQAKLDAKDVSIANFRKHIKNLKGKNVVEKAAPPKNAKVIAPGMFKLDLEPLAPKVLKNRDAHIDYIKHSQEHADTLSKIVKRARALRTLDSDLNSACKYVQRIQAVLVYVTATCPILSKPSKKLVAVTPLNKNKKVRNEEFY
ncbi:hypothetical protein Tco_0589384 [Tanacetum coccineum]